MFVNKKHILIASLHCLYVRHSKLFGLKLYTAALFMDRWPLLLYIGPLIPGWKCCNSSCEFVEQDLNHGVAIPDEFYPDPDPTCENKNGSRSNLRQKTRIRIHPTRKKTDPDLTVKKKPDPDPTLKKEPGYGSYVVLT